MTRKTASDLDDDPASVGGAMSQWPRRTLAWLCRDARVESVDPAVAEALLAREADDLADLAAKAKRVGIDTSTLSRKRQAIADADAGRAVAKLNAAYAAEYDSDGFEDHMCPFEESGLDKACWRCPVPARALDGLMEGEDP